MEERACIREGVYYVGVNDRCLDLFEGMWPLPYGVSYNSYLIADEKVVLVDTVDVRFFDVFLEKIRRVIGVRPVDYLVINHMEPDHSGCIGLMRQYYPDLILVGNKLTFGMTEGFCGVSGGGEWLIKEGDLLDTGRHKLRFYLTPMVHWPETMMTYDESEGVLFSGDAFGCFGTLDGGFLDTQINTDRYWGEMRRYYANVVGKYGSAVQRALQKLSGLSLEVICSTHGPVWTREAGRVVGLYDAMSRYEAEKGVVIAYGSMYGNTGQMAEVIAEGLSAGGIREVVIHNAGRSDVSYILADVFRYKGVIIGSPTYSNGLFPVVEALLSHIETRGVTGRYWGWFGSYCWAGAAVKRLLEFADKNGCETVGGAVEMKQSMNGEVYERCRLLGREMAMKLNS